MVSFLIKDTANHGKLLVFNSMQNAKNRPQLVITMDPDGCQTNCNVSNAWDKYS
ncbi:MAG: hypothetical protein WKG06_00860 [Segetibacter sp.]